MSTLPVTITDYWGDQYARAADVAGLLGVSVDTVRDWVKAGKLQGRLWRENWYYVRLDGERGAYALLASWEREEVAS